MFIVNVKIAGAEGLCALFYNAESKAEAARDGRAPGEFREEDFPELAR